MTRAQRLASILATASLIGGISACGQAADTDGTGETKATTSAEAVTPSANPTMEASTTSTGGADSATSPTSESSGASQPVTTTSRETTTTELPLVTPENSADGGILFGNASDAPTLSVYLDFQCPYCGVFSNTFGEELRKLSEAGTVRLSIHPMSFLDAPLKNDSSHRMANAFACAAEVGKGLEFEAAAFRHQPSEGAGYSEKVFTQIVKESGITGDALQTFNVCEDESTFMGWVNTVDAAAQAAGVQGTPSLLLDGKVLPLDGLTQDPASLTKLVNDSL